MYRHNIKSLYTCQYMELPLKGKMNQKKKKTEVGKC